MKKRILIATLLGAVLGIFCIIGVAYRLGVEGNELYLFSTWFNRLLLGFIIGFADRIKFTKKYNFILRGLFFGLLLSSAHYMASGLIDEMGFVAGIAYGLIIDTVATKATE